MVECAGRTTSSTPAIERGGNCLLPFNARASFIALVSGRLLGNGSEHRDVPAVQIARRYLGYQHTRIVEVRTMRADEDRR